MADLSRYQEFVDALEFIDDEDMRFEYIIDLGKQAQGEPFPEHLMTDDNLMHGCMSKVWIVDNPRDGRHYFRGHSDAVIVGGLVAMMTESFSGLTGTELQDLDVEHVRRLNLGALTTQRQVGMMAMLDYLKRLGRAETEAASHA